MRAPSRTALAVLAAVAGGLGFLAWRAHQQQLNDETPADLITEGPDLDAGTAPPIDDSDSAASQVVQALTSIARGIRNNNPGNIRKGSTAWRGLAPVQSDSAFLQFESMAWGIRAMVVTLRTYARRYGLNTPAGLINRWAPPSENHTTAYVRAVAEGVGAAADEQLDLYDPGTMFRLVRAMIRVENGAAAALLVSDATIREGVQLAD